MSETELKYWVGLSGFKGMGVKRFRLLRQYYGTAKKMWQVGPSGWKKVGVGDRLIKNWASWWQDRDLDEEMIELEKRLIKGIFFEDNKYPKLLKEIDNPPFIIFGRGRIEKLGQPSLAVVGSRQVSEYGQQATKRLVRQLVAKGLIIVSGLARGVDSLAHRVCLNSSGTTVAVLGHGLDKIYPKENWRLAERIVKAGGVLLSEYPLGYPISRENFPLRNRIVAGLCQGVLVVEGRHRSGTKITAGFAADYGREVFAVPGPIDRPGSEATADLIKQGAKLVSSVEDIMEELRL
jgi:DNA processing protein